MRARRALASLTVALLAATATHLTASPATAAKPGSVALPSVPFAGVVAIGPPSSPNPGGPGTAAGNAAISARCNAGESLREPQWFTLPAGDGSLVYARVSGLQYSRIAPPVPVGVAFVNRTDGSVLGCDSGVGEAQAPAVTNGAGPVDVVAYFTKPYQDLFDGLPDTLRLLVDHTSGTAPANDDVDAPRVIGSLPLHQTVDTSFADDDNVRLSGCHWLPKHTAWWSYTPATSSRLSLTVTADLPAERRDVWPGPALAVARVTDAGPVQIAPVSTPEDDCNTPVKTAELDLEAGATYLIAAFVAEDPGEASLVVGGRITLDVKSAAPEAPTAPTQTAVTAQPRKKAAKITWAPPAADGGSAVTAYRVQLRQNSRTGRLLRSVKVTATTRSHRFAHLKRGRTYDLGVRAVNAVGTSPATGGTFRIARRS